MEINKREQVALLRQDGSVIYHFAPPVMQLYYKNPLHKFFSFRFTTYTRTAGFRISESNISCPEGIRNPSVLLSPEMACSVRQHPLSGNSGRKRYNTLDFARQNRVPTGCFLPYWKPGIKGICYPFEIPARSCICTHKLKNGFVIIDP